MEHLKEATLLIHDLNCKVCVRRVLDALRGVEGVDAIRVSTSPDLESDGPGAATIKYHEGATDVGRLRAAVEALGYVVEAVREPATRGKP